MIIPDKIKEHSCAIQPAFGYGGGGGGGFGLNFAIMFDQAFNLDIPPVDDDEFLDPVDPPIYFQQIDDIINQQGEIAATVQTSQGTTVTGYSPQPQLSVAQLVANAVQHHIATHHAALGPIGTNNAQAELSVAEMISNAIQEQLATPPYPLPGMAGVLANAVELQLVTGESGNVSISTGGIQQHTIVSNQSQVNNSGLSNNSSNNPAAAQPSQQIDTSVNAFHHYLTQMYQDFSSHLNGPLMNEQHNNVSQFPPDEDSNSSIPPFNAPVSSPAHLFSSNDFNASGDEGYAASVADIIIIDSAGDSENIDEN